MPPKKAQGRGIDFEHRFRTSRWAEDLLFDTINKTDELQCFRLGLSQVSKNNRPDVGKDDPKIPDLLVFRKSDLTKDEVLVLSTTDLTQKTSFELHNDPYLGPIISKASSAIEVEFSPYKAKEMKGRSWQCKSIDKLAALKTPRKQAEPPTAPNIWIKLEDLPRLQAWEALFDVNIVVAHIFDQEAFAIALKRISEFEREFPKASQEAINTQLAKGIFRKEQSYDRSDAQGARETKTVFVVTPSAAETIKVGEVNDVKVEAQVGLSASKKYVAHTLFTGGSIILTERFLNMLSNPKI